MKFIAHSKVCSHCEETFPITDLDLHYYAKLDVPPPTWCPTCRHLRRHAHINDYVYFTRNCDCCRKQFISIFPPTSDYVVYCQQCWYAEARNDRAQARDYDFNRPFFEQFDELMHAAPMMGMAAINCENCDYCQSVGHCKNCYLISESSNCEDCYYCYWIQKTMSCLDCCYIHECETCYEVSDSFNCYNLKYSQNCTNCSDSVFLDNCIGCSYCAFSTNLRHKQYHIENKPYSREEYLRLLPEYLPSDYGRRKQLWNRFQEFLHNQPRKHLQLENAENCTGDYIRNAKNCRHVFHCYDAEDCAYGEHVWRGAKDCMDANTAGRHAEFVYESTNSGIESYNVKFCRYCWGSRNIEYSNECINGSHLFGCVGLKPGANHLVLNKPYSPTDYTALVSRIKESMLKLGEYGEFFPPAISSFGYNISVSYDNQPFSEDEIHRKGWKWESAPTGTRNRGTVEMNTLPEIGKSTEGICAEVLSCVSCARNYRIITQEYYFYREANLPLPTDCPDCRHRLRLSRRNPKKLIRTQCAQCSLEISTTLNVERFKKILCERCYQRAVY